MLPTSPQHHRRRRHPFDSHALAHAHSRSFRLCCLLRPPSPSPHCALHSTLSMPLKPTLPSSLPPARSETLKDPWKIDTANSFHRCSWSPLHFTVDLSILIIAY